MAAHLFLSLAMTHIPEKGTRHHDLASKQHDHAHTPVLFGIRATLYTLRTAAQRCCRGAWKQLHTGTVNLFEIDGLM